VAAEHEAQWNADQRVDERQVLRAGIAEDDLDSLVHQTLPEDLRAAALLAVASARRMIRSPRFAFVPRKTKSPGRFRLGACRATLGFALAHGTPESQDPQDNNNQGHHAATRATADLRSSKPSSE